MKKEFDLTNGKKIRIFNSSDISETPREWDNLSKMIFIGSNSHLGDKHDFHDLHDTISEHQKHIEKELDVAYITPIYGYSHGVLTISTTPFNCHFDSGLIGWSVVTKKDLRDNFNIKRITKKHINKAIECIGNEIEILNQYINGEIYGFEIIETNICNLGCEHETIIDSCSGFYGDDIRKNGILEYLENDDVELLNNILV